MDLPLNAIKSVIAQKLNKEKNNGFVFMDSEIKNGSTYNTKIDIL